MMTAELLVAEHTLERLLQGIGAVSLPRDIVVTGLALDSRKVQAGDLFLAVAAYNYGPNAVSPGKVPDGAKWYAAYIHRHLQSVLSGPFQETGRVLILEFTFYRSASDFAAYLKKAGGDLPVEIFQSRKYTYDVYLTYKTAVQRDQYLQRLMDKTGIKPLIGG